jgi:predicted lipid-binding transport protein (Tim44 family)
MGDDTPVFDILIFAAIAIFLLFRLRSVLGRRTGEEAERPNPFDRPPMVPYQPSVPDRPAGVRALPTPADDDPQTPLSLDTRISRITAADPGFDEKHFLAGAKAAFQMIVQAFAVGDLAALRPLLSSHLYGEFGRAISQRDAGAAITFEGQIGAEIADARVTDRDMQVQVRFVSRQIHAGDTQAPEEAIDLWTFARDVGSRDPNWQLVETAVGS